MEFIPDFGGLAFTLLAFIAALSIIVAIHEYGHYIVGAGPASMRRCFPWASARFCFPAWTDMARNGRSQPCPSADT
jgi:hypothetical protein